VTGASLAFRSSGLHCSLKTWIEKEREKETEPKRKKEKREREREGRKEGKERRKEGRQEAKKKELQHLLSGLGHFQQRMEGSFSFHFRVPNSLPELEGCH
jgi:hypothetical protein